MENMDDCPQPPQLLLRCCIREKEKVEINYREIRTDVITGGAVSQ